MVAFGAGAAAVGAAAVAFVFLVSAVSFDVWSESAADSVGAAELGTVPSGSADGTPGTEAAAPVTTAAAGADGLLTTVSPLDPSLVGSRQVLAPLPAAPDEPGAAAPAPPSSDGGTGVAGEEEPLDPGTGSPPDGEDRPEHGQHGGGNRPPARPPAKPVVPTPPAAPPTSGVSGSDGDDDGHGHGQGQGNGNGHSQSGGRGGGR
jgi:hypothetical protein